MFFIKTHYYWPQKELLLPIKYTLSQVLLLIILHCFVYKHSEPLTKLPQAYCDLWISFYINILEKCEPNQIEKRNSALTCYKKSTSSPKTGINITLI